MNRNDLEKVFSVIAQASCRITKPKEVRGSEGQLRIYLDMSKIPLLNLENWKYVRREMRNEFELNLFRHQEFVHELNAILEQNIRQSNCLDLESLCINAGELVTIEQNLNQLLIFISRFGLLKSI